MKTPKKGLILNKNILQFIYIINIKISYLFDNSIYYLLIKIYVYYNVHYININYNIYI